MLSAGVGSPGAAASVSVGSDVCTECARGGTLVCSVLAALPGNLLLIVLSRLQFVLAALPGNPFIDWFRQGDNLCWCPAARALGVVRWLKIADTGHHADNDEWVLLPDRGSGRKLPCYFCESSTGLGVSVPLTVAAPIRRGPSDRRPDA